jgi:hypothetical protein
VLIQEQKKAEVWFSSNVKPLARCPEHPELPAQVNPVFVCESCGREYCPAGAGRVWFECEVCDHRVLWYKCPDCPIGLGFLMLPKGGALQPGVPLPAASAAVVRCGSYEALCDGSGASLLVLDGKERYAWLQTPDSIHLAASPPATEAALSCLQRGEYVVVDQSAGPANGVGLVLYLQFPHGYQEYLLPEGWPEGGESKPVRVSPRALSRRELDQLLPHQPQRLPAQHPEKARTASGSSTRWRREFGRGKKG